MKIIIDFIPVSEMRYPTCGDYYFDENGDIQVKIAKMGLEIHEAAILIHELTEMFLLRHKGEVSFDDVDKFDLEFEEKRARGYVGGNDEPGSALDCPYRDEHNFSTVIEMAVLAAAGVSWDDYENKIEGLFNGK